MKAVIIDDEPAVRNTLQTLIADLYPDIFVSASAGTMEEGFSAIESSCPDLVFLDIELPDGSGFDLLKRFSKVLFKVIFVTGHQEYAIDAIKVSALDYILKPVDPDEFSTAVQKAREVIDQEEQQIKFHALLENITGKKTLRRIILHTSDHLQLVSLENIIRIQADSNYSSFRLVDGKQILVSKTIREYEILLSGTSLIRVHQSHMVNMNYIDKMIKKDGGYLLLKDGTKIPLSRNSRKQILQSITDFLYS